MSDELKYPNYFGDSLVNDFEEKLLDIAHALEKKKAQFLFGAGMAKECKIPTGDALAIELLNRSFFRPGGDLTISENGLQEILSKFPLEAIMEAVEKKVGGREELKNILSEILLKDEYKQELENPNNAYRIFNGIRQQYRSPNIILTTNFDYLFETEIRQGKAVHSNNVYEIEEYTAQKLVPVLHLHGVLDEVGCECIITEQDVFNIAYNPLMRVFEKYLYASDVLVFVGYSMNDPDIKLLYRRYLKDIEAREKNSNKQTFVVFPTTNNDENSTMNDDENAYRIASAVWESRGAKYIPLDARTFFHKLEHRISKYQKENDLNKIASDFSLKRESVMEKVEKTKEILLFDEDEAIQFLLETKI